MSGLVPQITGTIGNNLQYTVRSVGTAVGSAESAVERVVGPGIVTINVTGPLATSLQSLLDNASKPTDGTVQLPTSLQGLLGPLAAQREPLSVLVNLGDVDGLVSNLCDAVEGLSVQSGVSVLAATSLTGAIMARLDSGRVQAEAGLSTPSGGGGNDGRMSLGATEKARPGPAQGSVGPLTVYSGGTFLAGSSTDRPDAAGLAYDGGSGMIGLEYSVNRNLILGVAGSFATIDANLNTGATVGAEVIHGAAYMSYATRAWFVDALAAYGAIDLDMGRPGTTEQTVRGSTSGGAVAVAARGGYLFDFGRLRAGPIAGLTYVHARIDGYREAGDDPSALKVEDQTVESLTGSAGVRFLAPFQAGGSVFVPYLNVTLEHQFGDGKAELTTSLTGAPSGSPVSVSFPTFGTRDYGKVEGGLTVELTPSASVSLSGASTFARDDGQDYRLSAGLNYRF